MSYIKKVKIKNFKCFEENPDTKKGFELDLNNGVNIIVGDNGNGKSTILEAINLALSSVMYGRHLRYETLSQYLFNQNAVKRWQDNIDSEPPIITIELYFEDNNRDLNHFIGEKHASGDDACGIQFQIALNEKYRTHYTKYIQHCKKSTECKPSLPLEYYDRHWTSFDGNPIITAFDIPIKSFLLDSSGMRSKDGSDIYINRIVKEQLHQRDECSEDQESDIIKISQNHRKMKRYFSDAVSDVSAFNGNNKSGKKIEISVNLKTQNAWEDDLIINVDDSPFHYIGKGEQSILKTELSLDNISSKQKAKIILIEEPENHLSHAKLNQLLEIIEAKTKDSNTEQVILTTHSSFVANKMHLRKLLLINSQQATRLENLSNETQDFFSKLPGYDTLRLLLCKAAILVEGRCDELAVQAAYKKKNNGKLPIEECFDVISVGKWEMLKHFAPLAKILNKKIACITDNDAKNNKLDSHISQWSKDFPSSNDNLVQCFYATNPASHTLEVCMFKELEYACNNDALKNILTLQDKSDDEVIEWMQKNKTDWALKVFDSYQSVNFPKYILNAIEHVKGSNK